jgi:hypothetical protein
VTRPSRVIAPTPRQRNRRYVPLEECEALWAANESVDHPDVGLLHGWHLNQARVPVLPSVAEPKLDVEIRCRIWNLPEAMGCDRMYQNCQFWYDFLAWEHTARRRSTFHDEYHQWEAFPIEDSPSRRERRGRGRRP